MILCLPRQRGPDYTLTFILEPKKGNLATPTTEQAVVNTPKAGSSTVSNDNITQNDISVNTKKENSTQQTLHAVVSEETSANAKLFKDIISEKDTSVNIGISCNVGK